MDLEVHSIRSLGHVQVGSIGGKHAAGELGRDQNCFYPYSHTPSTHWVKARDRLRHHMEPLTFMCMFTV